MSSRGPDEKSVKWLEISLVFINIYLDATSENEGRKIRSVDEEHKSEKFTVFGW